MMEKNMDPGGTCPKLKMYRVHLFSFNRKAVGCLAARVS
jgi:hypothetical protein